MMKNITHQELSTEKANNRTRAVNIATSALNIVLRGLILGSGQEIYESYINSDVGPGIIRLLTIEVGGICRMITVNHYGPKKTLLPESILFIVNSIQLGQYAYYEL